MTEYRVLGPIEIRAGGRPADPGQPRQRAVLAALLTDAGRPVPVDTLVDRVWGQTPPREVRSSLHAHIARIRRLVAPDPLVFAAGAYLLDIDPARVDLHLFRELMTRARSRPADDKRLDLLRQAVPLWRGEPLSGLGGAWAAQARQSWRQEHLAAAVLWGEAELAAGAPGAVLPLLGDLADEHPLTESLAAVLMRALAADGRPAEALARYEAVRRALIAELGTDPSSELQVAYRSILRAAPPADGPAAPAQLPADVAGFTGRAGHLAQLDAALREDAPTSVVIALSGTPGVGKTTLAVHWAHTVKHRFPDGQLYVNLRGFDPAGRVLDPADAVRGFLDTLGVTRDRIPAGLDAQSGLFRSLLAGRRILVLLDNARDAEQVRPLLPATAGAVAVVTSRTRLTGLLAAEGARPVTLDVLSDLEARDLLSRRIGSVRTGAEPAAVETIVAACARLPLALAIAAARAQQNTFPLAVLAADLAGTSDRLDALDTGDPAVQVRAVFSWSYAALSDPAARLFRLLGLHPGPDVATAAAAALAGLTLPVTRRLLGELTDASLLTEHAPGRYGRHDLLRAYAADRTATTDPADVREAAVRRLLDHYVHTAHAADRLLYPARDPIDVPLTPPADGAGPRSPADHEQAMAWFGAEHPVLLAAARLAAETGHDAHAWQLAWTVDTFLFRRGHWHDRLEVWSNAVPAADRLGDLNVRAAAHRSVARAATGIDRYADAQAHLRIALDLCVAAGNQAGQANVHNTMAYLYGKQHDNRSAVEHAGRALVLYRAVGNLRGQAVALSASGWHCDLMGDYPRAIAFCREALELLRQVGDRRGEADVWDSLGYAHLHLGRHTEAADCFRQALDLVRDLGDRHPEAEILLHLGETHESAGDPEAARAAWRDALAIYTDLDHPDAGTVRTKLAGLPPER